MRLSFLPGDLHLKFDADHGYVVRVRETTVLITEIQNHALKRFREIRRDFEARFPPSEVTADEKRLAFFRELLNSKVKHNSLREQQTAETDPNLRVETDPTCPTP